MTLEEPRDASFADPETEFYLPSYPSHIQGHFKGEPTGEVVCIACWAADMNIDEIPHEMTCPQRFVHSRYWRETNAADASDGKVEAGAD